MKLKKKFVIFYIFNIFLLAVILLLSVPISKFLGNIKIGDNANVKDQRIANPDLKPSEIINRTLTINFVANVNENLNWKFKTLQSDIILKIGEQKMISYEGKNVSNKTITSTADFFVSPESVLPYLIKTECFCFTEQTLEPGESKIFNMVFFLDPSLDSDEKLDDLKELVFTYEFSEYKS